MQSQKNITTPFFPNTDQLLNAFMHDKKGWQFSNSICKWISHVSKFPVENKSAWHNVFPWYEISIALANSLLLHRQQAITETNDDPFQWHIWALPGFNEVLAGPAHMKLKPGVHFTNMDYLYCQHGWVITCPIKCGMKLLIHSQTSMVQPLKFGNGYVISSHTF